MPARKETASSHARRLVRNFENAVRAHEMKGSMHPDDWDQIEQDYKTCKHKLQKYIGDMQEQHAKEMTAIQYQLNRARDDASRLRFPDTSGQ